MSDNKKLIVIKLDDESSPLMKDYIVDSNTNTKDIKSRNLGEI